mmetsp:Transcript_29951/g.39378  ORF Transcript_29951/g.39378 Transcript_29951/m.39378 type:complete len:344 (-) Transcript_29951:321-1352(-)
MAALINALKKKKTPSQLTTICLQALPNLEECNTNEETKQAASESIAKRLNQMKIILYGEEGSEPNENKCVDLARALKQDDALIKMVTNLQILPFESRKDLSKIFNAVLHRDLDGFSEYMLGHVDFAGQLVHHYQMPEIALISGSMLREIVRHPDLNRMFLESDYLWPFFDDYVHNSNFDVASDAFATLRELLTKNKEVAAQFLDAHYDAVFEHYSSLLNSGNYVTKRQSLKLLGELLLDRTNFSIMMKYISDKRNMKQIMMMMRDPSANIQFEAFHVFKVFVANPRKPADIVNILLKNRDKLLAFLENFHNDKEDNQFIEEKQLLISTLSGLEPPAENSSSTS